MGERQSVECPVCFHATDFNLANVRGQVMSCVSCGEEIAEVKRGIQEQVDVLRCQPFSKLAGLEVS